MPLNSNVRIFFRKHNPRQTNSLCCNWSVCGAPEKVSVTTLRLTQRWQANWSASTKDFRLVEFLLGA